MIIRTIISLSMMCILLVSCSTNNNQSREDTDQLFQQSNFQVENDLSNEQIASHLAILAQDVPDVDNATAIVLGPYAVVGINIDAATERQRVGTIKYSVSEALRDDPYGKTAVVIADADVAERIQEMRMKIEQGHPVRGIVDELAEIVGRYMPTFPVEQNQPQDPSENQQKMNPEEQKEMKKIEEEQSNQQTR